MISTYFNKDTDYCPSLDIGKKNGNKPYKINGQNVWSKGKIINCNLDDPEVVISGYSHTIPECPKSLEKCEGQRGLCYDREINQQFSTYMLPKYDYDPKIRYGNINNTKPIKKDGKRLWYRQNGACTVEAFTNINELKKCDDTKYGCCDDMETIKENEEGSNCPNRDRRNCLLKEHGCCPGTNIERKKECPLHYKCTDKAGNVLYYSKKEFEENNMIENKNLRCELVEDSNYCVNNPENYTIGGNCPLPIKYSGSPSCGYNKRIKGAKIFGGTKCAKFQEKTPQEICNINVLGKGANCNGGMLYINDPKYQVKNGEWEKICPGDPNCATLLKGSYLCPPFNSFSEMAKDYNKCINGNASSYIKRKKILENGECKDCNTSFYNTILEKPIRESFTVNRGFFGLNILILVLLFSIIFWLKKN